MCQAYVHVSAWYVKEEMRVYFIGKTWRNVSAFKNIKSVELQRSSLTS